MHKFHRFSTVAIALAVSSVALSRADAVTPIYGGLTYDTTTNTGYPSQGQSVVTSSPAPRSEGVGNGGVGVGSANRNVGGTFQEAVA